MDAQQKLLVRGELMKRGFSVAAVARKIGVSRSTVEQVLNGTGKSARVENGLTEILGFNPIANPPEPPRAA